MKNGQKVDMGRKPSIDNYLKYIKEEVSALLVLQDKNVISNNMLEFVEQSLENKLQQKFSEKDVNIVKIQKLSTIGEAVKIVSSTQVLNPQNLHYESMSVSFKYSAMSNIFMLKELVSVSSDMRDVLVKYASNVRTTQEKQVKIASIEEKMYQLEIEMLVLVDRMSEMYKKFNNDTHNLLNKGFSSEIHPSPTSNYKLFNFTFEQRLVNNLVLDCISKVYKVAYFTRQLVENE